MSEAVHNPPAIAATLTPLSALHPFSGDSPDYDGLRGVLQDSVPFNSFVGLTITELGPSTGRVEITHRPQLTNAFGTLHAGVLFLAADMAGSAAFIGATAPRLRSLTLFALRDCRIAFLKPGLGNVVVSAVMDDQTLPTAQAGAGPRTLGCDARAYIHDSTGRLIGKAHLDFAFAFAAQTGNDDRAAGHA